MKEELKTTFLNHINPNLGIAHKIAGVYSDNAYDKEDLLQEMMYQLWKSYPSYTNRAKFSTWMYSVCLNTALTYQRKIKTHTIPITNEEIPAEPVNDEENSQLLMRAIMHLSPLNKAIIILYFDELSYEEISAITGITKSNVSVRLVRIKKELETNLKKIKNGK